MEEDFMNGIAPDPRSDTEKAKDHQHSDLAGDVFVNWVEKTPDQWKRYASREQDGSLSCVGQACAKAFEILGSTISSAHPIYRSRSNYPDGGMWLQNAGDICKNVGTTTEILDPSQNQTETEINRPITVLTPLKISEYRFVNPKMIDKIAEAIELYKHCVVIFHGNKNEWTAKPVYNGKEVDFGHCVCYVDYFLLSGEKILLAEDSTAHAKSFDGKGARLFNEDYIIKRSTGAFSLLATLPYVFTKTLRFGMRGTDVSELQKKLKTLGNFPATQMITQYFGNITLAAVKKFQAAHNLVPDGIVGKLTNAELNKL